MFNKPCGCITARKDEKHMTVMEYLKDIDDGNIVPVGRLDKETEGLLLFTDDGVLNQRLMRPETHVAKKYYFEAFGELTPEKISRLESGVYIEKEESLKDRLTKPAVIEIIRTCTFKDVADKLPVEIYKRLEDNLPGNPVVCGYITITEGKKRQIRRMMKTERCFVIYLKRISLGALKLDKSLKPGEYRELTGKEIEELCADKA